MSIKRILRICAQPLRLGFVEIHGSSLKSPTCHGGTDAFPCCRINRYWRKCSNTLVLCSRLFRLGLREEVPTCLRGRKANRRRDGCFSCEDVQLWTCCARASQAGSLSL